jgi:hypothetical protein
MKAATTSTLLASAAAIPMVMPNRPGHIIIAELGSKTLAKVPPINIQAVNVFSRLSSMHTLYRAAAA